MTHESRICAWSGRREPIVALRTLLGVRLAKTNGAGSAGESSDAVAFGQLFGRHAQAVYAFCARRTADLTLAEDLTSVTFLEAWRHRDRAPSGDVGNPLPWLLGVSNNVVRNARRGQRRYQEFLERLPVPSVVPPAEDEAIARSETEATLRLALDSISQLPEREQEVVMLVLWSGLSYEEAATALAIPVGTVRSRLSRARFKLQFALDNRAHAVLKESS
jgi:RNA polymerase sigma factor (sigma-70 family)